MANVKYDSFQEYVSRRCEEILQEDEAYQKLNEAILNMESEFKKTLTMDQRRNYNKIEEAVISSITHAAISIYNNCLLDNPGSAKIYPENS